MEKWGIWMGKIKEEGKGRKKEKSRLFICAVIFLISAITIGCGGYVDNNGNIVESSDAEQDSIFYQNKELTQFDVDVYQYFKNYERDYADIISFRKDLPGRVILIIDEGSPITPWDILDFKMKEDGRFEFEIVDKNKNGEIKLKEGDILMGWVDRFYIKSGKDIPPEYIRWVNFFGKVTSVISDRDKRVLLVYTEPENLGYVIDSISLENIYLDWADIIEEAASPQAPKFNLVRVSSHLEAKSLEGKKRILLKFHKLSDCLNYIANQPPKYIILPNISVPIDFEFGEAQGEIKATIGSINERWGSLGNIPTNILSLNGYVELELNKLPGSGNNYYVYAGAQGLVRLEVGGMVKFISAKRECTVLKIDGQEEKYFYLQINNNSSGKADDENLYQRETNIAVPDALDIFKKELKVFSFKEEYSGWGYDVDLNFKIAGRADTGGGFGLLKNARVDRKTLVHVTFGLPFLYGEIVGFAGPGVAFGGEGSINLNFNFNGKNPVEISRKVLMGKKVLLQIKSKDISKESIDCNELKNMVNPGKYDQIIQQINSMWGFKVYKCQENIPINNSIPPSSGYLSANGKVRYLQGLYLGIDATLNIGTDMIGRIGIGVGGGSFTGVVSKLGASIIKIQLFPQLKLENLDGYIAALVGGYTFVWVPIIIVEKKIFGYQKPVDMRPRWGDWLWPFVILGGNSKGYEIELLGKPYKKNGDLGKWDYKSEIKEEARVLLGDIIDYIKEKL